ncbi:hypothetical protein QTO30_10820 [Yoonia sp. GPGPB17]|uniref:transferrin-binding protein-like solute binding protein n=1 Tax=Yoonia sp. GPGPB17 TaxID=3026147 RepID=UPI0030BDF27E
MRLSMASCGIAACVAGGAGSGSNSSGAPAVETPPGVGTPALSDRTAACVFDATYVVLEGDTFGARRSVTFQGETGAITTGALDGADFDDAAIFSNPVNGEFSRVVQISDGNVFGVVGLTVPAGDLPASGSVTHYNEGWVNVTAAFETDTLVLTGDAAFTVNWGGGGGIAGTLYNFSVESASTGYLSGAGSIVLSDGAVSGDNFSFGTGTISGTGDFARLGGAGTLSSTTGTFFGPQADELGGVIVIDDPNDSILVVGAFQAD